VDEEPSHRSVRVVRVQDADEGSHLQELPRVEGPAKDAVGGDAEGDWEGTGRFKLRDLLTDDRCSQAVLDFLTTADAGRLVPVEKDAQSEASEW
jgi:hypothetical protein